MEVEEAAKGNRWGLLRRAVDAGDLEMAREQFAEFRREGAPQEASWAESFDRLMGLAAQRDDKPMMSLFLNKLKELMNPGPGTIPDDDADDDGDSSRRTQKILPLLHWAAFWNFPNIVWCILQCEPDVDVNAVVAHYNGCCHGSPVTAIHVAAYQGNDEVVEALLTHKDLDVNCKTCKIWSTPLHTATTMGNTKVVKALCQERAGGGRGRAQGSQGRGGGGGGGGGGARGRGGLRPNEEDGFHRTPLKLAIQNKNKDIQEVLMAMPEVEKYVEQLYRDRQVYVDAANTVLVGGALIATVTANWLESPLQAYAQQQDVNQFAATTAAATSSSSSSPPPNTFESRVSSATTVQGFLPHMAIQCFTSFNSLSFFFAIATVIAAADATFPVREEATSSYIGDIRDSVRLSLMLASSLFITSVVCVLGAFASAGFAILPPIAGLETNMIITVIVGGIVCGVVLAKFLVFRLSKRCHILAKTWFSKLGSCLNFFHESL